MGKLIDGDELIELLLSTAITDKQREYSECVQYAVQKMPTVDAVPVRHGKWVDDSNGIEGAWNYCSVCGEQAIDLYDYCPNCGARMDGKDGGDE